MKKLLFYSVISNYWTTCSLGLIKKTHTVLVTGLLSGWKKLLNILTVGSGLFCKDFEFVADVILVVCDPILYVGLWFSDEFFVSMVVDAVMSVVRYLVSGSKDSLQVGEHILGKPVIGNGLIIIM